MRTTENRITRCAFVGMAAAFLGVPVHTQAAQRTFVSTGGNDGNACSLAEPCRGFAKAITVTDPNGELVVLDSGGYGAVTVNKNVTIISPPGVYGGLSVFAGSDGITVLAPAAKVVLRGLTINGQLGNNGVRVQAGEVHVENTVISNMAAAGILVEGGSSVRVSGTVSRSNVDGLRVRPAAGAVSVLVRDSEFSHNATAGIGVSPSAGGASALVTVERSSVNKNGAGLAVAPGAAASATVVVTQSVASENAGAGVSANGGTATVYVRESAVTRNGTGLQQQNAGVLNACGANLLVANTTAMSGAITTSSCLDVASGSGTVTSVATGAGLTGGPITAAGTINLATTNLLPTVACAANQVPQWTGSAWTCANAATGSVTSLGQGTGITLSANPITTTGSIAADTAYLQRRVSGTCAAGSSIRIIASDGTVTCQVDGSANAFVQGGNAFGATAILGTTDNQSLDLRVNNSRVMRYQPNAISPNVVGGHPANNVSAGVRGATIAGGGVSTGDTDPTFGLEAPNRVTDAYGTVGGGYGNVAGNSAGTTIDQPFATVGGGIGNTASGGYSTVGGGIGNIASGLYTTVGGGRANEALASDATVGGGAGNHAIELASTVGGGSGNLASGLHSTVGGGGGNIASNGWSTVGGGILNTASGRHSIVPGGDTNTAGGSYSFAGGRRAKATADGSFMWADSSNFDFGVPVANFFAVRATGGVGFTVAIDPVTGGGTQFCDLSPGIVGWQCVSDRDAKENFELARGGEILARLATMPLFWWNFKGTDASVRNLGPTAQDFHAAFGLGTNPKLIASGHMHGVALAAIQGMNQKLDKQLRAKDDEIAELRSSLVELKRAVEILIGAR